jgi:uncharacterized protein (DUF427 family)
LKALLNGVVVAEAADEDVVHIEGNAYFPPSSLTAGAFTESPTPYTCPWKGPAQYFDVTTEEGSAPDGAWSYPDLLPSAVERVGRDVAGYVAFGPAVTVTP